MDVEAEERMLRGWFLSRISRSYLGSSDVARAAAEYLPFAGVLREEQATEVTEIGEEVVEQVLGPV